jgi:crossover junction endodeoxyribonuclease RuvC
VNVLGVDSSLTATGVCWASPGSRPHVHTYTTRANGKGVAPKLARLTLQVGRIAAAASNSDVVMIEGLSFGSHGSATRDLAGLWWLAVAELETLGVPLGVVAPSVLKKWATGRGNADKFAVAQAVSRLWPDVDLANDNEADALGLASIGLHHLGDLDPRMVTGYREAELPKVEWLTVPGDDA